MKIGPVDVSVATLSYAAGVVAAVIALTVMWKVNSEVRYEAWYRGRILRAMNNSEPEKGIEACQTLASFYPAKVSPRMYLGDLLYRQGKFKDAEQAFADAAALPAAKPEDKALALVGRAASVFSAGGRAEQAKAAAKAEVLFQEALKEDQSCVDALVNLGVVSVWKGADDAWDQAEKYCKRAAAAPAPASLQAQAQLYILNGVVAMRQNRPDEATAFFERARALLPTWKDADAFRRIAILAAAIQKDVEPNRRKELLLNCEKELAQFGKDQTTALNALAVGWWLLRVAPEHEKAAYATAMTKLQRAMDLEPKDPRAYLNATGLKEEYIAGLAAKLEGEVTYFKGETPSINKYLLSAAEKTVSRFKPNDRPRLQEIGKTLKEIEGIWQKYMDKAATKQAEKVEAKLWQLSCIRRLGGTFEVGEESQRQATVNRAVSVAKELANRNADDPAVQFTLGQVLCEKADYGGAYAAYKAAAAKGMKTPELQRLLDTLGRKAEIVDIRPPKDKRWFGPRPVIGGTLRSASSGGVARKVEMKIGDKQVEPVMIGEQVLYVPGPNDMIDGDLTVSISVTDALGRVTEVTPFAVSVDRKPPSWSVEPDPGAALPAGKVVFKITLADRSAIDYGSVKLILKEKKTGNSKQLIGDGNYKTSMPDLNPPRKIGHPLDSDTFQVSNGGQDLAPGEWELTISAQDVFGNVLSDTKKYNVK